jgi:hypothetical protein
MILYLSSVDLFNPVLTANVIVGHLVFETTIGRFSLQIAMIWFQKPCDCSFYHGDAGTMPLH